MSPMAKPTLLLASAIREGSDSAIDSLYPDETKIMELNHIGYNFRAPAR